MATLVSDIINEAFNALGVTQPGETVSTTIQTAAFLTFQQLMQNLTMRQELSFLPIHQTFSVTAGTNQYILGVGQTFNTSSLPLRVTGWISKTGNFYNGGQIMPTEAAHAQAKNFVGKTSQVAEIVSADQGYPYIAIEIWPVPATSPGSLELDYLAQWPAFSTVGDTVTLPPGWEMMLVYQLALALAPQYSRQGGIPQALTLAAESTLNALIARNVAILQLQSGPIAPPPQV
jgi:hypothetical protein